jgi:hypothetical protein
MTNRELTELAAKALGIKIVWERSRGKMVARQQSGGYYGKFDPANDCYDNMLLQGENRFDATRRAVLRAAAEIGRSA